MKKSGLLSVVRGTNYFENFHYLNNVCERGFSMEISACAEGIDIRTTGLKNSNNFDFTGGFKNE